MKARFLSGFQDDFNSSGILGGNVSTTARDLQTSRARRVNRIK